MLSDSLFPSGRFTVGDKFDRRAEVTNFPATDGYTLSCYLKLRGTDGAPIAITAATDSDNPSGYRFQVAPGVTANWPAGTYEWSAVVAKTGDRQELEVGSVILDPDPASSAAADRRSAARKELDAFEAAAGASSGDVLSYTIGTRTVVLRTHAERNAREAILRARVFREDEKKRLEAGLPSRRMITVWPVRG